MQWQRSQKKHDGDAGAGEDGDEKERTNKIDIPQQTSAEMLQRLITAGRAHKAVVILMISILGNCNSILQAIA
jgi:hypothetical protein